MRRVLVTGANKGIGRAIVAAILEQGNDTFAILGSRDITRGQEAKKALTAGQSGWEERILVVQLDVTSDDSVNQAANTVKGQFDDATPLYAVVNNAGIGLGTSSLSKVLDVNVQGIHRVCTAFLPLISENGRIVNITSASGPNFVNKCSPEKQQFFLDKDVTWEALSQLIEESLEIEGNTSAFEERGLSDGSAYGLSKALANSYTMMLAKAHPNLKCNACTPGFIETDLTRPYAEASGRTPTDMGMKTPKEGSRSAIHLLFGELEGNGWYYGSDAQRSPLDRYRSPGAPPYQGE